MDTTIENVTEQEFLPLEAEFVSTATETQAAGIAALTFLLALLLLITSPALVVLAYRAAF